jgi:hypothetical protein
MPMAQDWKERPNSVRTTTNPQSITAGFVMTGETSRGAVRTFAAAVTPKMMYSISLGPLYRSNISIEEKGPGHWFVDITWGPYDRKELEAMDINWHMNTTGGTRHVTQAISVIRKVGSGSDGVVDYHGAIGVNEQGDVEGIDILDPVQEWTENYKLPIGGFAWTYMDQIVTPLTAHVNLYPFRGKPTGSVLFKGGTGGRSTKDPMFLDLSLTFAYSKPLTTSDPPLQWATQDKDGNNVTLTLTEKEGWHELDFHYVTQAPSAAPWRPGKRLAQVTVNQVYFYDDFAKLGVGTSALQLP